MRPFEIDWWPNRIVCENGAVRRLAELVAGLGRRRAFVICGKSIAAGPDYGRVVAGLGERFAGAFQCLEMHAPLPVLEAAAAAARQDNADCVVSIGGGSAIDSGKALALIDAAGADWRDCSLNGEAAQSGARKPVPAPRLAHIAVPTTTGSGSEVAPTFGLRDPALGRKLIFRDSGMIPTIALLDPEMTLAAGGRLTAASGMTAVARSIEALYSGRRNPFYAGLALEALRMLATALPRTVEHPDDIAARAQCQIAAAMSAIAANVNVSAVHAVGHVVGGKYGLQHGIAHAILLAPAMRLMLPALGDQQRNVLAALGGNPDGRAGSEAGRDAAVRMAALVASLPLPQRLTEVGVQESDLPPIAEHASQDPIMLTAAAPASAAQILTLLKSAM